MSIDTSVSLKRGKRNGLVIWAGLIMILQGVLHGVGALIANGDHWPTWLAGGVSSDLASQVPSVAAFWLSWGSFGLPLALLGAVLTGLGRAGRVPPLYVPITFMIWGVLGGLMAPSPLLTALIPGTLLLMAAKSSPRRHTAAKGEVSA
jgi:hypothetical protein